MSGSPSNISQLDIEDHDGSTKGLKLGGVLITKTAAQINQVGDGSPSASPAAAGTTVANATALTAQTNAVTGADGTKGVVLPVAVVDKVVNVINTNGSNSLKVYAVTGSQINALGSTVAFVIPPGGQASFVARSTTLWYTAARRVVSGQRTMLSAADTVATGLSLVESVSVAMESDPILTFDRVTAQKGDQAGAPAAGSIIIKGWMPTDNTLTTPIAATGFAGIKVNWIAVGT